MEIKTIPLDSGSNVISNTNALYHTGLRKFISLWFKFHEANEITVNGTDPDRPITGEGFKIDGDLIITSSWTYGFGIHRINNDGTLTRIYMDQYPHSSYQYMGSVAIDKINKIAVVGSHGANGITFYDYSQCFGGTDVVVKKQTWTTSNSPLTMDEPGMSYINGLGCAGEWFYGSWDEGIVTVMQRWKYNDDYGATDFENIVIQNRDGSAHRDGAVYEDPENDRIFVMSYYDGEMVCVTGASTASPKAFHVRTDDLPGVDNDHYMHVCVVDKDNPNHIWGGAGNQFYKMDITACIVDGGINPSPTLLGTIVQKQTGSTGMMTFSNVRMSSPFNNNSTFIMVNGSNGWNRRGGWVDTENFMVINIPQYPAATQSAGKDWLYFDYGAKPKLIQTANGTKYWVVNGYGSDGGNWRTYAEADMGLMESGEVILGTFQLDNTENIGKAQWLDLDNYIYSPSGSSISILVSNNNGSTWESYTPGSVHIFSSTGNQLQIKIVMTGNGYNSGYMISNDTMVLLLFEKTDETTQTIKPKHRLLG